MGTRKAAPHSGRSATPNDLSDEEVSRLVGIALRQAMRDERVSVRHGAHGMRLARSTVEQHRKKGFVIPPLRMRRLAVPFLDKLSDLIAVRNGRSG